MTSIDILGNLHKRFCPKTCDIVNTMNKPAKVVPTGLYIRVGTFKHNIFFITHRTSTAKSANPEEHLPRPGHPILTVNTVLGKKQTIIL